MQFSMRITSWLPTSQRPERKPAIVSVNMAVGHLDQVTQQNAALVEEASAATQSMAEQARALREAVAVFRIGGQGMAAA